MSTKYNASINISKIKELIQSGHPSIKTAQNGKTYMNIDVWVDDEEKTWDDGNKTIGSVVAQPTKEERELKTKHSLGNLKLPNYKVDKNALGDLPEAQAPSPVVPVDETVSVDDLPF